MTWREANLSLQLAAEHSKGARQRLIAEFKRAQEDAAFAALRDQLGGTDGPR